MDDKEFLINKLKAHDWYYEHSEDHNAFVKGLAERTEIYELFCKIPAREIEELILDYVPRAAQEQFVTMLTHFDKTINFIKGKT